MYLSFFHQAVLGTPKFRTDLILPINGGNGVPYGEVLFVMPNGTSAENFFSDMRRNLSSLIRNDMSILRTALEYADAQGYIMSVNANIETVFSDKFEDLMRERHEAGKQMHNIEITEQGGVPDYAEAGHLQRLHKKYGIDFMLDDLDLADPTSYLRVETLGAGIQVFKFDHHVWHRIRDNRDSPEIDVLRVLRTKFPDARMVMEGVIESDWSKVQILRDIGIDSIQIYNPACHAQRGTAFNQGNIQTAELAPVA